MTILKYSKVKATPTADTSGRNHRHGNNVYKRNTGTDSGSRSWKRPQSETSSIPNGVQVVLPTLRVNNSPSSPPSGSVQSLPQKQLIPSAKALPAVRGGPVEPTAPRSWKRPRDDAPLALQPTTTTDAQLRSDATVPESTTDSYGTSREKTLVTGKHTLLLPRCNRMAPSNPCASETTLRKVGHGKLVRVVKNSTGKRIQLTDAATDHVNSDDNTDGQSKSDTREVTQIDDSKPTNTTRLTDHAYRSHQGKTRSLVRVPINEAKTRICPTVFQRQRCFDPACRKRHDVAPECTIPICTFFQKPGLGCRSGDACPFQHVKVNSRTPVCPNFKRLGFCEETSCTRLHLSK